MFQIVFGLEKFHGIEGRGAYNDSLSKMFCLTKPKVIHRETPMCSKKFSASNYFLDQRRGYHNFMSSFFCLTVTKLFVVEPFSASLISGFSKIFA